MFGRQKIATLVAEFLGTGVLTLLILTVQRSTIGVPFFVAAVAGLAVMLMTFSLGSATKAHFNPAITLGWWTARRIETITAILYIAVQFFGAFCAYALYKYYVHNSLQQVGGHFTGRILVAEAVGTGVFAFGFAAAVYQGFTRAVTASFVGLSLMLGVLAASSASIGLLNPAVALGVKAFVPGTYVLGPVIGAIVGINLYALLFAEQTVRPVRVGSPVAVASKKPVLKKKSSSKK